MARQTFILEFIDDLGYYMTCLPGGRRWGMVRNELQAKQFTYLQAVRYCAKYPGRFQIVPSIACVL